MANKSKQKQTQTVEEPTPVELVTIKALATEVAELQDIEAGKAAKRLRTIIRNNFEKLAPMWPALTEEKENRDGNRYPAMPRECADAILARMRAKTDDDSEDDES